MPNIIQCPASDTLGRRNFPAAVLRGVTLDTLRLHASPSDLEVLKDVHGRIRVWGLRMGPSNQRTWDELQSGDVAVFYMDRAFRYYATVVHKWIDPSATTLSVHSSADSNETFPLKFSVQNVRQCNVPLDIYNDLVGYKPLYRPHDPRILKGDKAAAVLANIDVTMITDENDTPTLDAEGRRRYRRHLLIERRASNRSRVIAEKGPVCEACGFDFLLAYGPQVGAYAEVHHLRPLGLGETNSQTIDDFAVLCANCHRAVHRPSILEPRSIADLRALMEYQRSADAITA